MSFEFMDPPGDELVIEALIELYYLGAIDENGRITDLGSVMVNFPLEPSLSKLLVTAYENDCVEEMLTIAAMVGYCFSPFL